MDPKYKPLSNIIRVSNEIKELAAMNPTTATGMVDQANTIARKWLFVGGGGVYPAVKKIQNTNPFLYELVQANVAIILKSIDLV